MPLDLIVVHQENIVALDKVEAYLEGLTKEKALQAIKDLANRESEDWFRIGGVLSAYKNTKSNDEWLNLIRYAQTHFKVDKRKAYYLVDIYECLTESGISFEQVKDVGWTKLKEFAHLLTVDNVDYWVKTATSTSTKNLISLLKSPLTTNAGMSTLVDTHLGEIKDEEGVSVIPIEKDIDVYSTPMVVPAIDAGFIPSNGPSHTLYTSTSMEAKPEYWEDKVTVDDLNSDPEDFIEEKEDYSDKVSLGEVHNIGFDTYSTTKEPAKELDLSPLVTKIKLYPLEMVLSTITEVFPHISITQELSCKV